MELRYFKIYRGNGKNGKMVDYQINVDKGTNLAFWLSFSIYILFFLK